MDKQLSQLKFIQSHNQTNISVFGIHRKSDTLLCMLCVMKYILLYLWFE